MMSRDSYPETDPECGYWYWECLSAASKFSSPAFPTAAAAQQAADAVLRKAGAILVDVKADTKPILFRRPL